MKSFKDLRLSKPVSHLHTGLEVILLKKDLHPVVHFTTHCRKHASSLFITNKFICLVNLQLAWSLSNVIFIR